jgi:hypothetical protein
MKVNLHSYVTSALNRSEWSVLRSGQFNSWAIVLVGSIWGLWWTKQHWGRFSPSTSVSPASQHSTDVSIIIITRGWHNRPIGDRSAEWTQLDSTPHYSKKKIVLVTLPIVDYSYFFLCIMYIYIYIYIYGAEF